MNTFRIAYIVCSVLQRQSARSPRRSLLVSIEPPNTDIERIAPEASNQVMLPELYTMNSQVDVYAVRDALIEASTGSNKKAAIWSAVAALFGAIADILGIM